MKPAHLGSPRQDSFGDSCVNSPLRLCRGSPPPFDSRWRYVENLRWSGRVDGFRGQVGRNVELFDVFGGPRVGGSGTTLVLLERLFQEPQGFGEEFGRARHRNLKLLQGFLPPPFLLQGLKSTVLFTQDGLFGIQQKAVCRCHADPLFFCRAD